MSVLNIDAGNSICSLNLAQSKNVKSLNNSESTQICDNFSESEETQKFKEIVNKYDITNISRNEFNSMYKELYDNDLISFKEMAFATFDPTHIPGWQDGVSSISGWKMSSDPNQKMNFLEGLKIQTDWNKIQGDPGFQHNYDAKLALAEKIYYLQIH